MATKHMPNFGPLVQIADLPASGMSGIYFLYWLGEVVYVGQGKNIRARIGAHITECLKVFDAVSFIPCPIGSLLTRERALIRQLVPRYNQCAVARRARRPKDAARSWLDRVPSRSVVNAHEAAAYLGITHEQIVELGIHEEKTVRIARAKCRRTIKRFRADDLRQWAEDNSDLLRSLQRS